MGHFSAQSGWNIAAGWCLCYAHRLVTGVYPIVLFVQNWDKVSEWPDNKVVVDSWISEKWIWMWSVGGGKCIYFKSISICFGVIHHWSFTDLFMHVAWWVWSRDLVNIEFNICGTINHSQITQGQDMQTPKRLCFVWNIFEMFSLACLLWLKKKKT